MTAQKTGSPELLAPAGDRERLEAAVRFGADAVYLAGKEFGMRTASPNFGEDELASAVLYAHGAGVKVYLTCNAIAHNDELKRLPDFFRMAVEAGVDALILTDLGVLRLARRCAPDLPVHISTQAGVVNREAANAFYELGAKRIVLARELSLPEIAEIRANTPKNLELEAFVHGSMCVSFSGRCLLSSYLTGRDANRGDCAQPCRWKYALTEEKRPGQYFPISEDGDGTYLLNSRDMNMLEHLPELSDAGVGSFKIEGRAKSAYYAAVVTNAYRHAIDFFEQHSGDQLPAWIPQELEKVSHRAYSTGFYLGGEPGQVLENGGYVRSYEEIAVCTGRTGTRAVLSQRNRFFRGDEADVLEPGAEPYSLRMDRIFDETGEPLETVNHAAMTVLLETVREIPPGSIFRRKINHD
ncbi:U32 family peptidase [Caproiciproducens sp. NJN-50]|uniref:peptidase U32 family protein n=1 Tax=Acutalibacteraceae TaxID=3082771 RepID=UPI000FFE2779|nr:MULTISPECIES: U32 family peptidase [Acutalibacteraceae]QAT49574.1 U32 family peptidase [Caproiciproducens sp. NJN-50]